MSLNVETGTGAANSESYASVSDADAYHDLRGNAPWLTLTTAEKEESLRRATDYIEQVYGLSFKGLRVSREQELSWPRYDVEIYQYYNDSNVIPTLLKNATNALAYKAAQGNLSPDLTQTVKREKVDVLEVEYMDSSSQLVRFREIDNLLAPLLSSSPSGAMRPLGRC